MSKKTRSPKKLLRCRWNLWYSRAQRQSWFYKRGDRRERELPPDARVVKYYVSDSYNKVWPKCYDWIEQNMHYWIDENTH